MLYYLYIFIILYLYYYIFNKILTYNQTILIVYNSYEKLIVMYNYGKQMSGNLPKDSFSMLRYSVM